MFEKQLVKVQLIVVIAGIAYQVTLYLHMSPRQPHVDAPGTVMTSHPAGIPTQVHAAPGFAAPPPSGPVDDRPRRCYFLQKPLDPQAGYGPDGKLNGDRQAR